MKNILYLDSSIYAERDIKEAIKAFTNIADIEIKSNTYECVLKNCKYDIEVTKREFENYIIDITNKNRRYSNNDY